MQFSLQIVGLVSVFFICVSILSFCLKTHPNLRVPVIRNVTVDWTGPAEGFLNKHGRPMIGNWTAGWTLDKTRTEPHQAFFFVELVSFIRIQVWAPIIRYLRNVGVIRCATCGSRSSSPFASWSAPTSSFSPDLPSTSSIWSPRSHSTPTSSSR